MRYISKTVPMITVEDIEIMEARTPGIVGSFNITPVTDIVQAKAIAHASVIKELEDGEYIDVYDVPIAIETLSGWDIEFVISEA